MALLSLRELTMRFGGLTAVNKVDIDVESGRIFSVIGPNGAGKTTVFNAITGIYSPTEGTILFDGQELKRPMTWKVTAACLMVGLLTGLLALMIMANVDTLWRATIKNNNDDDFRASPTAAADFARMDANADGLLTRQELQDQSIPNPDRLLSLSDQDHDEQINRAEYARSQRRPFALGTALQEGWRHLSGEPGIIRKGSRWQVVSTPGNRLFASFPNLQQALTQRGHYTEAVSLARGDYQPVERDGKHVFFNQDGSRELFSVPDADVAKTRLEQLKEAAKEQSAHRRNQWLGLIAGMLIGGFGTYSVWQRSRRTPDVIALAGIARTFQNIRLFQNMTVLENVLVGMNRSFVSGIVAMLFRTPAQRREEGLRSSRALELLDFVSLKPKQDDLAKNLPYGEQRRLEIARALATHPKLILLDEPAAGMNPTESDELMHLIRRIRDTGATVLLIEHHMKLVMDISDRIAVLDYGQKIAEGTPAEIRSNPRVIEAYLGKEDVS